MKTAILRTTDITIEKVLMIRTQRNFRSQISDNHRDFETCIAKFINTALAIDEIQPEYFDDEIQREQRNIKMDFLVLGYAICIRVFSANSKFDSNALGELAFHVSQQLPHGNDYTLFALCLAVYMMQILKEPVRHSAEYMKALQDYCKKHEKNNFYMFFLTEALAQKQNKQFEVDFSIFTPSPKLINMERDWCLYTHAFRESYVKAWLDLLPSAEEKLQLLVHIEHSFQKEVQIIRNTEDLYNEEVADF